MNRRGIVARRWASSPAMMLAVGLATIAPGPGASAVKAVAAGPHPGEQVAVSDPLRTRAPHEDEAVIALPPVVMAAANAAVPLPRRPSAAPARPVTRGGGRFAYGYCTWWVASRRPIPWSGNAWQWWGNARAAGFAEGSVPRPGAIMVMGISWSSPQGHVAYVESVAADGSFIVSEMNWWGVPGGGWGRVDYRRVSSRQGIVGFIY